MLYVMPVVHHLVLMVLLFHRYVALLHRHTFPFSILHDDLSITFREELCLLLCSSVSFYHLILHLLLMEFRYC